MNRRTQCNNKTCTVIVQLASLLAVVFRDIIRRRYGTLRIMNWTRLIIKTCCIKITKTRQDKRGISMRLQKGKTSKKALFRLCYASLVIASVLLVYRQLVWLEAKLHWAKHTRRISAFKFTQCSAHTVMDEAFSHLVSDGVISDPRFNLSRAK